MVASTLAACSRDSKSSASVDVKSVQNNMYSYKSTSGHALQAVICRVQKGTAPGCMRARLSERETPAGRTA